MSGELVVYDVNSLRMWNYCTESTKEEVLKSAERNRLEDIKRYEEILADLKWIPKDIGYWQKYLNIANNAKHEVCTENEYLEIQKKYYMSKPISETTEEDWWEKLECLPPIKWCSRGGVEMFCMSEMWTGTFTYQYARIGDKYYSKIVDIFDEYTWIYQNLDKLPKGVSVD